MSGLRMDVVEKDASKAGRRDAFHVPAALVTCRDKIKAGDSVIFVNYKLVLKCEKQDRQAVVSPFIPGTIKPGEAFWVMIAPELVGDLVHHFEIKGVASEFDAKLEQAKEDAREEIKGDEADYDECAGCYGG